MKVNVIIACGGSGSRCNLGFNKILAPLYDKTVIYHTINKFLFIKNITKIIIATRKEDILSIKKCLENISTDIEIIYCIGGDTRTNTIKNALSFIDKDCDIVSIHDGARPFVSEKAIIDSIEKASIFGSGISAYKAVDTVAICEKDKIINVPNRENVYHIQTPQSFKSDYIIKAYSLVNTFDTFTDDSSVYAKYIGTPTLSYGDISNKKITFMDDLLTYKNCYIGVGYDTHRLVENRKLILGGIEIPHHLGLLGHSDADVLTHAIMDSIFNACGERDIGVHFPDTDPKYKGIDSTLLLRECVRIIRQKGYDIKFISAVIMCEKPKLAKNIPNMIENLANIIGIDKTNINLSATTTEGLGFVGREEGISVSSNCICYKV